MSNLTIEANICEVDGAYYKVKLAATPRIGELIDLYSFVDAASQHQPVKRYEVIQIVHNVHDVSEKISQSIEGNHFVSIYVKPSNSEYFNQ